MSEFKVLIPLDGSRTAEHSLVYLDALKALGSLQGCFVSVIDDAEEPRTRTAEEADDREENLLSTYLREIAGDVEKYSGVKLETKVLRGSPAERIISEAHDFAPDLIIVSTHGRSGTTRWRFGSVADKVIRGAQCNTLVIGPNATEQESWIDCKLVLPFKSILLPVDGSALAEQAIEVAQMFARGFNSTVHIVRIVPIPTATMGYGAEVAYVPDVLDSLVEGAKANVSDVRSHFGGMSATTEVVVGNAADELEKYSRQHKIDLVVMTSHGRGGFLRTALGSVTDRMLAAGSAPVLVVRPSDSTRS